MGSLDKTVLVIEDNVLNMKLFHDLLEMGGYNVLEAKSGMEGWRMAREQHPDLILMDIRLPDVSGIEVTRWLKGDETLKSIPVVAITAFAMAGEEEKIGEGGCDAYIVKPISLPNFLQTIERFTNPDPVKGRRSAVGTARGHEWQNVSGKPVDH